MAGVRTHRVTPLHCPKEQGPRSNQLHGGGFAIGGGMVAEAIPIANKAEVAVISVDYRRQNILSCTC